MKPYIDYMNSVNVSDTLHQKIMAGVTAGPKHRIVPVARYAIAFGCAIVLFAGFAVIPNLLSKRSVDRPALLKYNHIAGFTDVGPALSNRLPPQELSVDQVSALLPGLSDTHTVTAVAYFSGDGTLYSVDATATAKDTGIATNLTLSTEPVMVDYLLSDEPVVSEVNGIPVVAAYFENKDDTTWCASFELNGITYSLKAGGKGAEDQLPTIIATISEAGPGDLNVIIPAMPRSSKLLTIDEAKADPVFGAYVPEVIPSGFRFESASRVKSTARNSLNVTLTSSDMERLDYIGWRISSISADDGKRVVDVSNIAAYDLSLYPIPRASSVPDELREIVENPVFLIDDLTLDVVKTRAYQVEDAGDTPGYRMRFSVLYGETLVEVNIKGLEPEVVYDLLRNL